MGARGPVPKRSDQRIRRNKQDVAVETVVALGVVPVPELGIENPHPIVVDLYRSLRESAQAKYYEPSDWQFARLTMQMINNLCWSSRPSAQLLTAVNSMLTDLLVTEGARRRVRLEVEREQVAGAIGNNVAELFRQKLAE